MTAVKCRFLTATKQMLVLKIWPRVVRGADEPSRIVCLLTLCNANSCCDICFCYEWFHKRQSVSVIFMHILRHLIGRCSSAAEPDLDIKAKNSVHNAASGLLAACVFTAKLNSLCM